MKRVLKTVTEKRIERIALKRRVNAGRKINVKMKENKNCKASLMEE